MRKLLKDKESRGVSQKVANLMIKKMNGGGVAAVVTTLICIATTSGYASQALQQVQVWL